MIKLRNKNITKSHILSLIDNETSYITSSLGSQKKLNVQILIFLKSFTEKISFETGDLQFNKISQRLTEISNFLDLSNYNISCFERLLIELEHMKENISLKDNKYINDIANYNEIYTNFLTKTLSSTIEIEQFIKTNAQVETVEVLVEEIEPEVEIIEEIDSKGQLKKVKKGRPAFAFVENTLVISEKENKVILPYTIKELEKLLRDTSNKCTSKKQIVEKLFTLPMNRYKNSAISRFKEAYKLVKERDTGSKRNAFDLAIELFANYNLHPAIITACQNINELDIYLACLEYNELEDFHFFEIQYEAAPVVIKKNLFKKNIVVG